MQATAFGDLPLVSVSYLEYDVIFKKIKYERFKQCQKNITITGQDP